MTPADPPVYPDIADLLDHYAQARRERAKLSFGEKILRMEALRERVAPFKRAREERRAAQQRKRPTPPET